MSEADDRDIDAEPDDDAYERECFYCGGEGWDECDHPLECMKQHNCCGECRCASCGGSGLAKDMTLW